MKFSHKITWIFALFLAATLALFCFFAYRAGFEMRKTSFEREFQAGAIQIMSTLDKALYERFVDLKNITNDPVLRSRGSTPRQITERLVEYRNNAKIYLSLSFFDPHNIRIADTSGLEIGEKSKQGTLLNEALKGEEYAMSVGRSQSLEEYVVQFARSIKDDTGAVIGTIISRIPVGRLYDSMGEGVFIQKGFRQCVDLFDKNELLLFSITNKKGVLKDRLDNVFGDAAFIRSRQSGSGFFYNHRFHRADIFGFSREPGFLDFKGNGWRVVIHAPKEMVFKPVYEIKNKLLLFSLGALCLLIGMILVVAKELSRPLGKIKAALAKVSSGDFDANVEMVSDDEFGDVARALNETLVQLRGKTTSLDNLLREVDERVKIETRLTEVNKELRDKGKEVDNYVKQIERSREILMSMLEDNAASRDALEKSLAEVKQAHQMVIQAEKLSSIGQLAAGVAHEINNPLSFISSNLATLEKYVGKLTEILRAYDGLIGLVERKDLVKMKERITEITDLEKKQGMDFILSDVDSLLRESQEGAGRIKNIVLNLKTFSRKDEGVKTPADLNAILDGVINIIWNEIKYKAELVKAYGELPMVECNSQQIGQVFINILMNASQAIEGKGTITVSTRTEGDSICIEIADTGQGMSPEVKKHLFEPFFTTKVAGKGTGLGLSISYEIVKKHGGDILVQSEAGRGTKFSIFLPAPNQDKKAEVKV